MNKKDLVESMAGDARITRVQAARALDAFVRFVQSSLVNGDRVTLMGFGTFAVSQRKARRVREPHAGRTVQIQAKRVARFAPGLDLRAAVARTNGRQN